MRKKVLIFLLLILIVGSFFYFTYKRDTQLKIDNINDKLFSFKNNKISSNDDELVKYFNDIVETHNKISELEDKYENITIEDIKSLDNYETNLENKKEEISNLNYNDINVIINNYSKEEQKEILRIYNDSEIVKNENNDLKVKNDYLELISNNLNIVSFLKEQKNNYYISNNKIIYKNDNFKSEFDKFNTNIVIEKEVIADNGTKIPILMYHGVRNDAWGDTSLFVKTADFDAQMKFLSDNGYTTLFLSEIADAPKYDKPIVITFDDGYNDVYNNAFPILKKYNLKADFYIITDWVGGSVYVTTDMIKEMSLSGLIEIGSHTLNHSSLGSLSEINQDNELKQSKDKLEKLLNKEISTIAYPKGSYNSTTIRLAKKYYKYGVTVTSGFNYSKNYNHYALKRNKITRGMPLDTFKQQI